MKGNAYLLVCYKYCLQEFLQDAQESASHYVQAVHTFSSL